MKIALEFLGWFLLMLLAFVLFVVLFPFGVIALFFKAFHKKKVGEGIIFITKGFKNRAISIDQSGNTFCDELFNYTLVKKGYYPYGNPDETISGVTGKNKKRAKLSKVGKILDWILEKLDPGHSIESIEEDETWKR